MSWLRSVLNAFRNLFRPRRQSEKENIRREAGEFGAHLIEQVANTRGLGLAMPIEGGERNGDGEPAETYVMPSWDEIEK